MSRRRRKRELADNPFDERDDERGNRSQNPRLGRTRNGSRRWPYLLILFLVLLALLPNLLGWSGLHQKGIDYALKDFDGKVSVNQVRLGWLQPLQLTGIKAVDREGNNLLSVESLTTTKTLTQFISTYFRGKNYGEIEIVAPVAQLHLRPDGSNLEDALVKYLPPPTTDETKSTGRSRGSSSTSTQSPIHLPTATLRVKEGRALISSSTDDQVWQIDDLNLLLETNTEQSPMTVDTQCKVTQLSVNSDGKLQPSQAGTVALKSSFDPGSPAVLMQSIELALAAENFPVSFVAPVSQRFIGPARSAGQLTTKIRSTVDLNRLTLGSVIDTLNLREFMLVAPQLLGDDQVHVRNLEAQGGLQLSPQKLASKQFSVQSDFGKIKSNGTFDVKQLTELAANGQLLEEPLELDGEIDLAGLVRMLPATFKLHEDLQVDSGVITFKANTKNEGETRRLVFQADAANLKGRRGGQALVWQQALKLGGTIRQLGDELALENLDLQTDFLRLAGNATLQSGTFAVKGDLSKMVQRVGQFVDLSEFDLAGTIDGNFGWQAAEGIALTSHTPLPIQLGGQFHLDRPIIKLPELPLWQPDQLLIKFSGTGMAQLNPQTAQTAFEIQTGGGRVDIGSENATLSLATPIKSFNDPIRVNCDVNGQIAGWLVHLRNFVDLGDLQTDGQLSLKGLAAFHEGQLTLDSFQYEANQFIFDGYGMKIRDPKVKGTIDGSYDLARNEVRFKDVTLVSNAVAARGQNLRVAFAEKFYADGGIGFRGDVNRLAEWFELSPNPESIYWYGSAEGTVQFASQDQGVAGQLSAAMIDLIAAQQQALVDPQTGRDGPLQWVELYRDPRVQIESQMVIADDFNAIMFKNSLVKASAVSFEASGTIADLTGTLITNIQGRWNPAWDKVQVLLAAYTGNTLRLSGSGMKPFSIRGPLLAGSAPAINPAMGPTPWVPAQLEGSVALGWDQGSFLDVPIGASEINVDVKDSIGYIGTRGIPFSGGTIQLAPYVDMRGENPIVMMKPTRIIDNVALSQDTARKWLKYIAPLVADATSAQGALTLDMEGLRMPMFNPMNVEATGTIQLVDVVIGAGPLAEQLVGTVQQVRSLLKPNASEKDLRTWLQLSKQTIPFAIKDQTVYHENVQFVVKDITITTSGAVGFDQSLSMMAEIPIADDWIDDKPFLAGLRGQKLRIPIGGTVSKPVLDRRAIQGLSAELARSATTGAINQAITDRLAPKAAELQNKLNDRVTGELNKLQDRVGEKMGDALGQLPNLGGLQNGGQLPNLGGIGGIGGSGGTNGIWPNGILPNSNGILPNVNGILPNTSGTLTPAQGASTGGTPLGDPALGSSAPATSGQTNPINDIGKNVEDEVKKGINNLFKFKK